MKIFSVFHSPGLQLSERINITFTLQPEKIQWPSSGSKSYAEHVHSLCILLHSKCYCNIWPVFCWHLFSLLFYVNKILWDPGVLFPPLLYPLEKDSNLLQDFLLVFKPASCQPVGCSNRWRVGPCRWGACMPSSLSVWNWNELIRWLRSSMTNRDWTVIWRVLSSFFGNISSAISPLSPGSKQKKKKKKRKEKEKKGRRAWKIWLPRYCQSFRSSQGALPNFQRLVSDDRKTPTIRTGNSGRHSKKEKWVASPLFFFFEESNLECWGKRKVKVTVNCVENTDFAYATSRPGHMPRQLPARLSGIRSIEYASVAWPKLPAHLRDRLERRALKIIIRKPIFQHCDHNDLLLTLNQASLQSRRHYQSALVGFHLANQTAPQHLQEVCYPRASADHSLHHHNFFQLPKANSTLFQSSPLYFASHIFNILPKHIQSSTRLSEFKKKAQQYFLSPSCPCSMHALTSM